MLKIIKIHANDYQLLKEKAERQGKPAADLIHELLTKGSDASPYTQIIIDVWLNYWAAAFFIKYDFRGKDGAAAKQIGKSISKAATNEEPEIIGRLFEKILLSLKGTFYYGKELSTIANNFNAILAQYKNKDGGGIKGNW